MSIAIPHEQWLCEDGGICICVCAACAEGHEPMIEIRDNTKEIQTRERKRTFERARRQQYTLGELWTQVEAALPRQVDILLSRQVPWGRDSTTYYAETYDSRPVPKVDPKKGVGRTPEAALIDLLINMDVM